MSYVQTLAAYIVWRAVIRILAGALFGLLAILAFTVAGYWVPLALYLALTLIVWAIIKGLSKLLIGNEPRMQTLDELAAEGERVRQYAAGFSFDDGPPSTLGRTSRRG
jgi:hypothetical protein